MSVERALHAAVSAIYFGDDSDYRSYLWQVVRELDQTIADMLEEDDRMAYAETKKRATA